jgi:hypothetical protein
MRPSAHEVEERLSESLHGFVGGVPDRPPVPWSTAHAGAASQLTHPLPHRYAALEAAASVVIVAIATLFWASPSAGARYDHTTLRSTAMAATSIDLPVQQLLTHASRDHREVGHVT